MTVLLDPMNHRVLMLMTSSGDMDRRPCEQGLHAIRGRGWNSTTAADVSHAVSEVAYTGSARVTAGQVDDDEPLTTTFGW